MTTSSYAPYLYAALATAYRVTGDGNALTDVRLFACRAHSLAEAEGMGLQLARDLWPSGSGWKDITVLASAVPARLLEGAQADPTRTSEDS